ncbi:MAG: hypothetical protein H7067_13490 [Burkholderiales bacterium]|nr:hypothetical protein [Opitutaceae bacterium]
MNNIAVARPGAQVTSDNRNTNIRWEHNLISTAQKHFTGAANLVGDPRFVRVARDLREADFSLQSGSPGRDDGTADLAAGTDVNGIKRPAGAGVDRGAYER